MGKLLFLVITASLGGLLFGFDTAVISGTIGFVNEQYALNVVEQGWYVSSALVGCIAGVVTAGLISDRFGRKYALLISAALFSASALGCMIAVSFTTLVVFRLLGGIGVGVASMLSPLYISEISPKKNRGTLISLYQFSITVGILLAYITNRAILDITPTPGGEAEFWHWVTQEEVWRAMLGSEVFPALLFLILLFFIPESPRWLLTKGREQQAEAIAQRYGLSLEDAHHTPTGVPWSIQQYLQQRGIRLAIGVGVALALLSQFSGINAIIYYGPKILSEGNFNMADAFSGQILIGVINVLFTVLAIWKIDSFGRRRLLLIGASVMIFSLVMVGFLFYTDAAPLYKLIFILTFCAGFAFSYGPVVWVLLSELYPTKIRGRAMAISTLSVWIGTAIIGQLVPFLLETITVAGTFWLFALCCLPTYYVVLKLLPETKGKSLEEIERYWLQY